VTDKHLKNKHSLIKKWIFIFKAAVLILKRSCENQFRQIRKFSPDNLRDNRSIISYSESQLWNLTDNSENWALTAGKVENLRHAIKNLNGVEIKAGEVFSFWKQIGVPIRMKGYVVGREIREGCIVPTVAGGLCQLSNALYDAALKADFSIIERHKHSQVIEGSLAEQDRDATVKWNYIDLRFKASINFRIETYLDSDKLYVVFKTDQIIHRENNNKLFKRNPDKINDCYSCGNFDCNENHQSFGSVRSKPKKAFILNERWPEFENYIRSASDNNDLLILPYTKNDKSKSYRKYWGADNKLNIRVLVKEGIYRILRLKLISKNENIFKLNLHFDEIFSRRASKIIPIDATHVVVAQSLLPHLIKSGVLGGRTFDVLMTRLPLGQLHGRLDDAHAKYPDSSTLKDFRAANELVALENQGLTKARYIISPNEEILCFFKNKSVRLDWYIPDCIGNTITGSKILFPASLIGRKGAYAMKRLVEETNLSIMIAGRVLEDIEFWGKQDIEFFTGDFREIALVVYPTFVEHQPRLLLTAISHGIKIITTKHCGISASDLVTVIDADDYQQLKYLVKQHRK